jgi:hypothetical protein
MTVSLHATVGTKAMSRIFSSENATAIIIKFTWMIHASFANKMLFFHKFYSNGMQRLTERWQKCVENDGDFVEK